MAHLLINECHLSVNALKLLNQIGLSKTKYIGKESADKKLELAYAKQVEELKMLSRDHSKTAIHYIDNFNPHYYVGEHMANCYGSLSIKTVSNLVVFVIATSTKSVARLLH